MAEKSHGASRIERIGVEALLPYAKNSRTHSDEQVAQIAASIKEFGFNNPILIDKDNTVIAGHGRLLAARRAGMAEVPCIRLDHLTETQRKAYIIADNRLALNAGWDNEMLTIELNELLEDNFALDILGFDSNELKALLDPIKATEGLTDEDAVPEAPKEPKTKPGDIWVMGRQDYHWKHEPCLYGWKEGAGHLWAADRKQTTILEFDKPTRNGEHPTMKPVALFEYQMLNNTKGGDQVLDSFGGSGTTLIAAEKNGRIARIMELDPKYCDVIVKRWEEFTGKTAELAAKSEL